VERAREIYGYANFVCDSGGSICEVVDPEDPADPVLSVLSRHLLLIWIEGTEAHTRELVRRFDRAPKPMYWRPDFLDAAWAEHCRETGATGDRVDPDAFMRRAYARALAHRRPLYAAMARNWGVSVPADRVARVASAADFEDLVAEALEARARGA
jgi:hypothetical protein